MYYKALRPRPPAQHEVVTDCKQPEAKRQNITVKWNLDDNASNVNQFTGSVYPWMLEFSYAH